MTGWFLWPACLSLLYWVAYSVICEMDGVKITMMTNSWFAPFLVNLTEYIETEDIEWAKILRANYKVVRDEYIHYVKEIKPAKRYRNYDAFQGIDTTRIPWDVVMLKLYYKDLDDYKYFPKTRELLRTVPGCSMVMFSILHPKKYLPPHRGPHNGVLRYHLGLITDNRKDVYIEVQGERRTWCDGCDLMFDDTLVHHAYNDGDTTRVVLFLDIVRIWKTNSKILNFILYYINFFMLYNSSGNYTVRDVIRRFNKNISSDFDVDHEYRNKRLY